MENDKVKDLLEIMENHNLSEISLETPDGFKIAMKKAEVISENVIVKPVEQVIVKETPKEESKIEEKRGNIVKSPMVGTFYAKPSPTANQYVDIGSTEINERNRIRLFRKNNRNISKRWRSSRIRNTTICNRIIKPGEKYVK